MTHHVLLQTLIIMRDYTVYRVTMCDIVSARDWSSCPPYTPPQVEASPISKICFVCFGRGRGLVSMSAV
jgi:hypothetical protein